MENIKVFAVYKIEYIDKFFAKLTSLDNQAYVIEKTSDLPKGVKEQDVVTKLYNTVSKNYSFELTQKSTLDEYSMPSVVQQFAKQNNIKKIKSFEHSKWFVFCIENHMVCLCNLFDEAKRYVMDTNLELNANLGDIYTYVKIGKKQKYFFEYELSKDMSGFYANLVGDMDAKAKSIGQTPPSVLNRQYMTKLDKKATKTYNKQHECDFVKSWCIQEEENTNELGAIFRLSSDDGEELELNQTQLPKFAREGDFVGLTKQGEYKFNRPLLLNHIKKFNQLTERRRGRV